MVWLWNPWENKIRKGFYIMREVIFIYINLLSGFNDAEQLKYIVGC